MSITRNIIQNKCPNCGEGKVFKNFGNPLLFKMPEMHAECSECTHKFVKEPGYFFGAMYVSYGLAVAEMIAVFFISRLFVESLVHSLIFIMVAAFLFSTINFRYSRLLWIYMFDAKTESYTNKKTEA